VHAAIASGNVVIAAMPPVTAAIIANATSGSLAVPRPSSTTLDKAPTPNPTATANAPGVHSDHAVTHGTLPGR
jgi:hypothetical protein